MKLGEQIAAKIYSMDKTITYIVILLMLFSVALIYSSTGKLAVLKHEGNNIAYLGRHCAYLLLSFGVMVAMRSINYTIWKRYAFFLLMFAYGVLLYAILFGSEINGTSRWIKIPIISVTFQASEFAKIAIIIMTAKILSIYQLENYCYKGAVTLFLGLCGPLIVLVMLDDFSTAGLMGCACAAMFIVGRVQWRVIGKWILIFSVFVTIGVVAIVKIPQLEKIGRIATIKARMERFVSDEEKDITGKDNQEIRSRLALANGGLIGTGPGNSVQRNYLPHPYSDFIYAIIIEEYGIVFGILVILSYLAIFTRIGAIIRRCKRVFPALLITGLSVLFTLQALIHIGVCVGILPVTGQTLPFLSWGGSSLLFMGMLVGMILSVAATFSQEAVEGKEMDYYDTLEGDYHGEYTDSMDAQNELNEDETTRHYTESELNKDSGRDY
ncbi:MAG: FtsW/RodA/SpoVE family cell cycle protein [Marinifilaceae bacterium]